MSIVVHANWCSGSLWLWAEHPGGGWSATDAAESDAQAHEPANNRIAPGSDGSADSDENGGTGRAEPEWVAAHPFACGIEKLREALDEERVLPGPAEAGTLVVCLPGAHGVPAPSPQAELLLDSRAEAVQACAAAELTIQHVVVAALRVSAADAGDTLERLDELDDELTEHAHAPGSKRVLVGASTRYFALAARFVTHLLAQQRVVPSMLHDASGGVYACWQPWVADEASAERVGLLVEAMPPSARAAVLARGSSGNGGAGGAGGYPALPPAPGSSWETLEDFLLRVTDAACRRALRTEEMGDAVRDRTDPDDPHVTWLRGLLLDEAAVSVTPSRRHDLLRAVRQWLSGLQERGAATDWRLCLRVDEPPAPPLPAVPSNGAPAGAQRTTPDRVDIADDASVRWSVTFHLQSSVSPDAMLSAQDIWLLPSDAASVKGRRIDAPQEVLLAELGRAARFYRPLEGSLNKSEPASIALTTTQAYEFLREVRPVLIEQGFGVIAPDWWDAPDARLGLRLHIDSPDLGTAGAPGVSPGAGVPRLGLSSLVSYRWQIAVGSAVLTLEEFQRLAQRKAPLVRIAGRWVEIRPEDVAAAMDLIRTNPGGEIEVSRALRLAYAGEEQAGGLHVLGMEATGWVATVFGDASSNEAMPFLTPPTGFVGSLRPYQLKGLSWMAFLDRFGLGACLADDMGLGKTIQLLALLLHEREAHAAACVEARASGASEPPPPAPTLLVVPMSVAGNWLRESARFAPSLRVLVHHGLDRMQGSALERAALEADLVVTTYALASRDRDHLSMVAWGRIALDEAQNIKNPSTKQAQAIRGLDAPKRVALTGTPIENRLGELWSIMDFLNPGYLGSPHDFRRRFAVPIERFRDPHKSRRLRGLVQPFVLRRLKSDPGVVADLPEKVESKEYCSLTQEQASLYETCVRRMLAQAEDADGIRRRGVILSGLIRLKQICNHPAQFLKDASVHSPDGTSRIAPEVDPARSGKCRRLIEMLEEVVAAGGQALVFTQFRTMGDLLATMLRHALDRHILFLHGGTPAKERDALVARFQKQDGSTPVFILSLRAGGVGLNLTGANHVFHFDRWWNPAVETQATDRAYRIGQTRTVQVHKFIVAGTLEERIDQMIEQKAGLADFVIGAGERWLTELSLSQLRDLLTLRSDAVEDQS